MSGTIALDMDIHTPRAVDVTPILAAIRTVRIMQAGQDEFSIHDAISMALVRHGIAHRREYTFGEECRADIWISGTVIEIKKQRPPRAALVKQINRYAEHPDVHSIIVVMERSMNLPTSFAGKSVSIVSLNSLWGIAL